MYHLHVVTMSILILYKMQSLAQGKYKFEWGDEVTGGGLYIMC